MADADVTEEDEDEDEATEDTPATGTADTSGF
jgi:hypothetical protein